MEPKNVSVINPSSCTTSTDFKAEFKAYLGEAGSLSDAEIQSCRVDTDVVAKNVQRGVLAVTEAAIAERIRRELPTVDLEPIYDLPRLADTVAHAARLVPPTPVPTADIQKAVARGYAIRKRFFAQIGLLVEFGVVPPHEYDLLRRRRGVVGMANSLIDGAAILARTEAPDAPRVFLEAALIDEAKQVARYVLDHVMPTASPDPGALARADAAAVRDRLWTLLVRRYRELRRIAAWLWFEEAPLHVPALRSPQGHSRRHARATPPPAKAAGALGDEVSPQTDGQAKQVTGVAA